MGEVEAVVVALNRVRGGAAQVGESARDGDMGVNPVREKKLTNVRAAGNDEKVIPYTIFGPASAILPNAGRRAARCLRRGAA